MPKDKKLSITELKDHLKQLSQEELIQLIAESYKASNIVQNIVNAKIKGDAGIAELLESSKLKIKNEIIPDKGFGKLRVSVVKKVVADFKAVSKDEKMILDLMLYAVEMGVAHIDEYDDISEDMVDYIDEAYAKVIEIINKKNSIELFECFKDRIKAIVTSTEHAGCWGIHDSFEGSYSELKWQKEDDI